MNNRFLNIRKLINLNNIIKSKNIVKQYRNVHDINNNMNINNISEKKNNLLKYYLNFGLGFTAIKTLYDMNKIIKENVNDNPDIRYSDDTLYKEVFGMIVCNSFNIIIYPYTIIFNILNEYHKDKYNQTHSICNWEINNK